jgi:SM-20-related protein
MDAAPAAATLGTQDWCVLPQALPSGLTSALRVEAQAHAAAGRLRAAATGRGDDRRHAGHRGDSTLWLDETGGGPAARDLLAKLERLRADLNRTLLLGLHDVEAHFAHYPPGAGYARHRDRFRDDDARVLSLVLYLNADWPEDAGGALRLHLPDGAVDVAPRAGTVVMFLSDAVEHEVLASTRDRFSVAAWFRRNNRN